VLAFASIGLDHTEALGPTLGRIAAEKAGVLHLGGRAVSGPQAPEAAAVLEQQAQRHGCPLRWVEPLPPPSAGGPELGLRGELQRHNGAVAVAAAEALAELGWPITAEAIRRGLLEARWPGRLALHRFQGRPLLLDGAHNPPAAEALRRELDAPGPAGAASPASPRRWLIAMQRHKDAPQLLQTLLRPGDQARVLALPEHPSWSAEALQAATGLPLEPAAEALADNLHWLVASAGLPVACGSLYLVAELLPLLDATD
jgi:dihydrofolate synthase/folylpolyglutamate synthase